MVQRDDEAWAYNLWEVLFRWSASRLDLEKFSGMLHVWESRMVLYVFNVPRLHKHSQQVDGLHFLCVHPPLFVCPSAACAQEDAALFVIMAWFAFLFSMARVCVPSCEKNGCVRARLLINNIEKTMGASNRGCHAKNEKLTAPRGLPRRSPTLVLTGPCAA